MTFQFLIPISAYFGASLLTKTNIRLNILIIIFGYFFMTTILSVVTLAFLCVIRLTIFQWCAFRL